MRSAKGGRRRFQKFLKKQRNFYNFLTTLMKNFAIFYKYFLKLYRIFRRKFEQKFRKFLTLHLSAVRRRSPTASEFLKNVFEKSIETRIFENFKGKFPFSKFLNFYWIVRENSVKIRDFRNILLSWFGGGAGGTPRN